MAFHPLRFVQAEFDAGECDLLEVLFFSSVGVMSAMMPMTADWMDSASSSWLIATNKSSGVGWIVCAHDGSTNHRNEVNAAAAFFG